MLQSAKIIICVCVIINIKDPIAVQFEFSTMHKLWAYYFSKGEIDSYFQQLRKTSCFFPCMSQLSF